MALLVDAVQEVWKIDDEEDFVKPNVITNPRLRRKERTRPLIKAATKPATASISKPVKQEVKPAATGLFSKPAPAASKIKEVPESAQPAAGTAKTSATTTSKKPPPALKRGGSSNSGIMQAFSKAATKVKKEANASRAATPSGDDSSMHPLSDDGEDDTAMPQPKPRETAGRKSKRQREEELRQMMEEDDDEEEDQEENAPTPEEEPIEEPMVPEPKEEPSEVVTTSANGRRRGKRRIMRKKQIMDEQGYLGMCRRRSISVMPNLTYHSYYTGAGLGIFLRGRSPASLQAKDNKCSSHSPHEGQEGCAQGSGEHYVFLLKEVTAVQMLR